MIGTHKGPSGGCPSRPAEEGDRVLDAAVVVEDDMPNASVDLFVDAGIAAADAICCSRLGGYAAGDNHNEAISLLGTGRTWHGEAFAHLSEFESKVAYKHQPVSADERMTGGYHDARSRTLVVDSRVNDST